MKGHLILSLTFFILSTSLFTHLPSEESLAYESDEWSIKEECDSQDIEIENNKQEKNKNNNKGVYKKAYIEGAFSLSLNKLNTSKKHIKLNVLSFNSYLSSQYYEVFLGFKKTEKNEFSTYIGSVRFTPLLMHYLSSKLNPAISFYLGSFKIGKAHKNLYKPFINTVSPSSRRLFFPPLNALSLSKKEESLGIAFECALPFFNFYFFWKKIDGRNSFNLYSSYKNETFKFLHSRLNIAFISSFLELKENEKTKKITRSHKSDYKQGEYSSIFGIDLNFSSHRVFITSADFFNLLPKKKIDIHSMSFRGESGFVSKIVSLTSGVSYEGASYLGNPTYKSLATKKDKLSFYLQGKLKYKFFTFASSYNLLKNYKKTKVDHSYGFFYSIDLYSVGKKKLIFKNELFFNNGIYKLKAVFMAKPNVVFLSLFSLSSFLYLQEHSKIKNILKKYEIDTKLTFPIGKHIKLTTASGVLQKNEKKEWRQVNFFVNVNASFLFVQKYTKEISSISLKYNSGKNALDLQLKLKIEY